VAGPTAPPTARSAGFAVAALICGLVGVFLGFIPLVFFLGWLLAVLAIVFGVVGRKSPRRGMAGWGIGLGVLGLLTGVIGLVFSIALFEGGTGLEAIGSGEGAGDGGDVLQPGETATLSGDYTDDLTVRLKVTYLGAAYDEPPSDSIATAADEGNREWVRLRFKVRNTSEQFRNDAINDIAIVDAKKKVHHDETLPGFDLPGGGTQQVTAYVLVPPSRALSEVRFEFLDLTGQWRIGRVAR
jgi:hypothetical protein